MITGHLRLMVMNALSRSKLSGYDIKKYIEKESGLKPSFGSIYPLLDKLLKEGLVEFESHGRKKIYFIAKKGKSSLPGIEKAKNSPGSDEIFIFGGAQIFEQALPIVDKLYLTKINSSAPMADVFFPDYSAFTKVTFSEKHEEDGLEYEYVTLER